eukprot:TRINITY_DN535_c0_g1_i1.p1 TRINITY_DN535_c0_g1~~TRINITY_DN535_c0_g1_i1.p1  ORF type:complete len:568 (-),score=55.15 TRINITY_DN535_c0_g1_i1:50-1753(-)
MKLPKTLYSNYVKRHNIIHAFCGILRDTTMFKPILFALVISAIYLNQQLLTYTLLSNLVLTLVVLTLAYLLLKHYTSYRSIPLNNFHNTQNAIIVGGGFSGIAMAIQLKEMGIPFHVYESSNGIGGTWLANKYPGAGCDIPSFLYSFSFARNYTWTKKWAKRDEIFEYIDHVVDSFGLRDDILLNSEVINAEFNQEKSVWVVTIQQNDNVIEEEATWLISAIGQLNQPKMPEIPGIDTFQGDYFHSAEWNHNVPLEGKNIAIVGNGATAIQIIPEVSNVTNNCYVFQRSPSYITPKDDYEYPAYLGTMFKYAPFLEDIYRSYLYVLQEIVIFLLRSDFLVNIATRDIQQRMKKNLDPSLIDVAIPSDTLFCKRILLSDDYLPSLGKTSTLIGSPIVQIRETSIVDNDGQEYDVDTIVFCTGFQTLNFIGTFNLMNGQETIQDFWDSEPSAYLGITVPSFPNFFMLFGPNTNLGHNSTIFMIECQAHYIRECIQYTIENGYNQMVVKEDTLHQYQSEIDESLSDSWWSGSCSSWYKTNSGRIISNWPYSTLEYFRRTFSVNWDKFDFS